MRPAIDQPVSSSHNFGLRAAIALLFAALAFAAPSFAQTNTWQGTSGSTGNWSDNTKWSTGTVADGSANILLPTGTVNGNVSLTTDNAFTLTVAAPSTLNILSGTNLNVPNSQVQNSGLINNNGAMTNFDLANNVGATFNNFGTLNEPSKAVLNYGTFNNSGAITANGIENHGSFSNTGILDLDSHSAEFPAEVDNYSSFTNQATGVMTNTGSFTNVAGATLTNLGAINDAGAVVNQGTFNNKGTYTVLTGGLGFNGATLNNDGMMHVQAGAGYESFGSIVNSAAAQIVNDGDFETAKGQSFTNAGTITNNGSYHNGSVLTNSGTINNAGTFTNGISVEIAGGGTVNNSFTGSMSTTDAAFTVANGGTLKNSGTFNVDSTSTFTMAAGSSVINSATGQMNLSSPALQVVAAGNLLNNGTINMVAPPSTGTGGLMLPPPTLVIASTGTLNGTGFVNGSVTNFGIVGPGNATGTLTINGLYQQMSGSTMDILLGGAGAGQFGQLDVNGEAVLGGTLDVSTIAGFDPEAGEIFEILSGKVSGAFTLVDLPTLDDGLYFTLDQEANGVFLDVEGTKTGGGGSTTTPEPASAGLLALGLAAVALMNFARFRANKQRQAA